MSNQISVKQKMDIVLAMESQFDGELDNLEALFLEKKLTYEQLHIFVTNLKELDIMFGENIEELVASMKHLNSIMGKLEKVKSNNSLNIEADIYANHEEVLSLYEYLEKKYEYTTWYYRNTSYRLMQSDFIKMVNRITEVLDKLERELENNVKNPKVSVQHIFDIIMDCSGIYKFLLIETIPQFNG